MTRQLLTAFLLLALLLSGCSDAKEPTDQADEQVTDPVQEQLGGEVVEGTSNASTGVDTPLLLSANMGPNAPITAFRWTIPDGAIVSWMPIPEFSDFVIEQLIFEMVPIYPEGATPPAEYAILLYRLDNEAELGSMILGMPMEVVNNDIVAPSTATYTPTLEPRFVYIYAGDLEEGDEIGIVVAAKSDTASPFGLLLGPRDERPEDESAPQTAEQLLDGRTALALEATGTGDGLQYAAYQGVRFNFPPSISYQEVRSGPIGVEDSLPRPADPVASARSLTLSASFPDAGYSRAGGDFFAFEFLLPECAIGGTYDMSADAHGTSTSHRSVLTEGPLWPAGLVAGYPYYFVTGNGGGSSEAQMTMQYGSSCSLEFLTFDQFDLGATTDELFGMPAATGGFSGAGLVGNVPPMVRDGSLVRMAGGVQVEHVGWGDAQQQAVDLMQQAWLQQQAAA